MTEPIASRPKPSERASPEDLDELMQVTSPRGWIALIGCALLLVFALGWSFVGSVSDTVDATGVLLRNNGLEAVLASSDGVITNIAATGVPIEKGASLAIITPSAGQPKPILATFRCQILNRIARERDVVKSGSELLLVENLEEPFLARLYVPVNAGYAIETEMAVQISPVTINSSEFGFLKGQVVSAEKFPITAEELVGRLKNKDLAQQLAVGGPKLQILVKLALATPTADSRMASGYQWSSSSPPAIPLYSDTPCQGRIIVARHQPIHLVFPSLGK